MKPTRKLIVGVNDLKTTHPEIAAEAYGWDPATVTAGSSKEKKDWICSKGHIYPATPKERTRNDKRKVKNTGSGCPICDGKKVLVGFNDLKTTHPEIAAEAYGWDPTMVIAGSSKEKKDWRCSEGHIYPATPKQRTSSGSGCPICNHGGGSKKGILIGFNDLKSTYPIIAAEAYDWDPTTVTAGSNYKKSWKCRLGHIYTATIHNRTGNESGCPVCSGKKVLVGFNDLKTTHPDIAAEAYGWDPTTFTAGSGRGAPNWKCKKGHIYPCKIRERTRDDIKKSGCPYCNNVRVLVGFNDLKTTHPEIAAEAYGWDPVTVTAGYSKEKKNWICDKGHIYPMLVINRTFQGQGCSFCAGKRVLVGFNDLKTTHPDIAAEAYGWDPTTVTAGSSKSKVDWICKEGHIYAALVKSRALLDSGCPDCAEYGFNTAEDAWFYLMERVGEQQLGITNNLKQRVNYHKKFGWYLLDKSKPAIGSKVRDVETTFKKWLRKQIGLIEGRTENWATTSMEVRSLAELKAKSGIETDLF